MSDLIDLASPENRKVSGTKLSSPLIPLPSNAAELSVPITTMNLECQSSIQNNPFDIALQEINEFISKSEDPFEVVWQKATNAEGFQSHTAQNCRSLSNDVKDDIFYNRKRHSDILKMNKTLDDSLISTDFNTTLRSSQNNTVIDENRGKDSDLNKLLKIGELSIEPKMSKSNSNLPLLSISPPSPDFHNLSILNESIMNDSFSSCSPTRQQNIDKSSNIFTSSRINSSDSKNSPFEHNLSILNQSAMDDSLSGSDNSNNGLIKSIVAQRVATCIQKGMIDAETQFKIPKEKPPKLRRSFSQGDQLSANKFTNIHSHSIIGESESQSINASSMTSIVFEDPFNNAFMTKSSNNSATISDISAISSIGRLSSVGSTISSSGSNSIKNCAFIDDSSSFTRITSNINPSTNTRKRFSLIPSVPEISDLVAQYDRLKEKSLHNPLTTRCSLIDVNNECSPGSNKLEKHNITSDGVFLEADPVKPSVLPSEKMSINIIEKCNLKSPNNSDEDSIFKRPPRLVERSDNEVPPPDNDNIVVVGDLIELRTSNSNDPIDSIDNCQYNSAKFNTGNDGGIGGGDSDGNTKIADKMKELERELVEPEQKLTVATLLMELEKLVNNEKNPKAVELLNNLESVLGVKCRNNVELLEMCIQDTETMKDLQKGTQKDESHSEESKTLSADISKEDNTHINSSDSLKKLNCENLDINVKSNVNFEKSIDNNEKLSQVSDDNAISPDVSAKENSKSQINDPHNSFRSQKLVIDIQMALQKLLVNNNSDPLAFLEDLNKVLNPPLNASETKPRERINVNSPPVKVMSRTPRKKFEMSHSSTKLPIKHNHEVPNTLKKSGGLQRRSSISHITSVLVDCNTRTKTRVDSPKKPIIKRSSSDPDSINDLKVTKKISLNPIKLKPSVPFVNKTKLRKNNDEIDIAPKKGPLKAFLPIGTMQRFRSSPKKLTPLKIPSRTPPKSFFDEQSVFIGNTSTPNSDMQNNINCLQKSLRRKPVASSTPDVTSRISHIKMSKPQSPQRNMSWNISPVSPSAPKTSSLNNVFIKSNSKKSTPSINKYSLSSPKSKSRLSSLQSEHSSEHKKKASLLSHGQLMNQFDEKKERVRRSEPIKNAGKAELIQRIEKQKISSPLKENKTPSKKINSMSLISKFQRHSGSVSKLEKESKWK